MSDPDEPSSSCSTHYRRLKKRRRLEMDELTEAGDSNTGAVSNSPSRNCQAENSFDSTADHNENCLLDHLQQTEGCVIVGKEEEASGNSENFNILEHGEGNDNRDLNELVQDDENNGGSELGANNGYNNRGEEELQERNSGVDIELQEEFNASYSIEGNKHADSSHDEVNEENNSSDNEVNAGNNDSSELRVNEETSSDEIEEDEDNPAFHLIDCNLDTVVNLNSGLRARDLLLLSLGLSVRHNWSYENIVDHLSCQNSLLDLPCLPRSKEMLWNAISQETSGIEYHAYCGSCYSYLGLRDSLSVSSSCNNSLCKAIILRSNVKYFISLSLRKQLKRFLALPGIGHHLKYPHVREKKNIGPALQDIFDGAVYKSLVNEKIVDPHLDFTYIFNTDGVKIGDSKHSAYPLYIRINELPPNLRQKYLFLAAVWVDTRDPDMNCFMKPFVDQANNLSSDGIFWKPDGVNEIRSKFIGIGQCVDSKARCTLYNMHQFNGHYGCVVCKVDGVWSADNMRYPVSDPHGTSEPSLRTEEDLVGDMIAAETEHKSVNGVKGVSVLMNLDHFQMTSGCGMDDLHTLHEGNAKHHSNLLMSLTGTTSKVMRASIINERINAMKTPSIISRKLGDINKRSSWKGSMWRNWLLFYCLVCMKDLVPQKYLDHFALLSHASFLMCQDEIPTEKLGLIHALILKYVKLFEQYFGINEMFYNIHLLLHFVESIRNLGPLWCYSTYNFESWNRKCISQQVHSIKGVVRQIAYRHLIKQLVNYCTESNLDVCPSTVKQLRSILTKRNTRQITQSVGHIHFLGNRTLKQPSEQERGLLDRAGFIGVEMFSQYTQILHKSVSYSTVGAVNVKALSNDSVVYTWEDSVCSIASFVTFVYENREISGMFVWEHYIESMDTAEHIARLTSTDSIFNFVMVDVIRCPVVIMKIEREKYFGVLANCFEID